MLERQELVEKSVTEAKNVRRRTQFCVSTDPQKNHILVSNHWHEGIIGLIASKIAEEFYRPTLVLTKTNDGYKGSARSIPSFHVTEFLRSLKKILLTLAVINKRLVYFRKDQLNNFVTAVRELSSELIKDKDLERKIEADLKFLFQKLI